MTGPDLAAQLAAAEQRGAAKRQAAIVAWLRDGAGWTGGDMHWPTVFAELANDLEKIDWSAR